MHQVKASTFADPADVAAYKLWYQRYRDAGYDDNHAQQKAFLKGDNGVGWTGLDCTDLSIPYIALPVEDWQEKWGDKHTASGKKVNVTMLGKTVECILGDTMPHRDHIENGCGLDMAPGTQKAFGLTPGTYPAAWEWAE